MAISAKQNHDRCPPHPGEVIQDILDDLDYSKSNVAKMLGISRQQLHAILAARKPVSPEIAARLGKLFGNGPALWLRLQAGYDAWHAEREIDVSNVPSLRVA
ncbi:addiction module antidote protein, HigA family [Ectothiorhodospiraceae bacterium BW-2]|nr:addiction module antidote protein, HigA family [Ectothiorhodospiraceae bacterium BW-2]